MPVALIIAGITAGAATATKAITSSIQKNQEYNRDAVIFDACGKRPYFVGKRRKAYEECARNVALSTPQQSGNFQQPIEEEKNNTLLYVGIGAAALIGGYLILKKR
jgi:LPXTG-motif cell wall-anchored protein